MVAAICLIDFIFSGLGTEEYHIKQFVGCCNYFTMDISQLERNLDYVSLTGSVLNDEKRMILTNSLILLQNENQFTKIYLWGKILGLESDYFIAYGFKKSVLFGRVFYYR